MCGFSLINLGPPRDGLSGGALSSSKEAEFKCSIPTSQSKKKREIHRFFLYSVYLTYYHFDTYAICTFIRDVLLFFSITVFLFGVPSPHVVILSWDQPHFQGSAAPCAQNPDHPGCMGTSGWRVEEQS